MRFPLIHTGRRFFFLTLVVEGRRRVLSSLVRGEARPRLTALGERVAALWRRLHQIEPAFTASDFVIMPDHVHLLLIVNSAGEFRFNPLVFVHWFMAMTEAEVASDGGAAPEPPANDGGSGAPEPRPRWGRLQAGGPEPRPRWGRFQWDRPIGGSGAGAPVGRLWSRDYWVDVSFDSRQLKAIRRYIRLNPARAFWKQDHADMFVLRGVRGHRALDASLPWTAVGDLTILASPFLYPVRLTMKKTADELEDEIAAHLERAAHGWVPLCGFLSPGERAFERRLKALASSRWVKAVPYGLPPRYDPSVEDSRYLAAHRELILSSFEAAAAPPFKVTRANCLTMNARLAAVCRALDGTTEDGT